MNGKGSFVRMIGTLLLAIVLMVALGSYGLVGVAVSSLLVLGFMHVAMKIDDYAVVFSIAIILAMLCLLLPENFGVLMALSIFAGVIIGRGNVI